MLVCSLEVFFVFCESVNVQNVWWKQIIWIKHSALRTDQLFPVGMIILTFLGRLWTSCNATAASWHARTVKTRPVDSRPWTPVSILSPGSFTFSLCLLHVHSWLIHVAYTASSFDQIVLYVAEFSRVLSEQFMETQRIHTFFIFCELSKVCGTHFVETWLRTVTAAGIWVLHLHHRLLTALWSQRAVFTES